MSRSQLLVTIIAIAALCLPAGNSYAADAPEKDVPDPFKAEPLKILSDDNEMRKLLKERYNASLQAVQGRVQQWLAGKITIDIAAPKKRHPARSRSEMHERASLTQLRWHPRRQAIETTDGKATPILRRPSNPQL